MTASAPFTPVFLLTGFLGSGKTTLLARLLDDPDLADSAVLINEFGEVGLDHHLVGRIDETTVLLPSGCLCCTIRGELAAAIKDLLSKRDQTLVPSFRRLVIETTGLADPTPAIATLSADPVLRHHVRLGAVITTVDAVNGRDQMRRQPESLKQIAVADRLVLTKTDLCDRASADATRAALRAVAPDVPILDATADGFEPSVLLADRAGTSFSGLRCLPVEATPEGSDPHAGDLASFALVIDEPIDWTRFGLWLTMLLHRHGANVLRVKGVLNLAGEDRPVAIHGVQSLVHVPVHLPVWPDEDRRSRIVFITRGIDAATIARSVKAFGLVKGQAAEAA